MLKNTCISGEIHAGFWSNSPSPENKKVISYQGACMEQRTTANGNSTACLVVTAVSCELGISQQGSANNGYLHLSLGRSTQQTVQEVFILLERKSPCQRSMARLARITVIPNLQFLLSNSSWQVGAGFVPCEHYQSCNMKAGGKEGRREERKSSYGYCCHLGDFQWCLQK